MSDWTIGEIKENILDLRQRVAVVSDRVDSDSGEVLREINKVRKSVKDLKKTISLFLNTLEERIDE